MSSVRPFGELFSRSWARLKAKKKQLIIPAIFGGGLQGGGGGGGGGGGFLKDGDAPMEGESLSFIPKAYAQGMADGGPEFALWIAGAVFAILFVLFIVIYIAHLYSLLVIYDQHKGFKSSLRKSFAVFFPYIGLSLWSFIRSYVWIPFLVIIASGIWLALQAVAQEAMPILPIVVLVLAIMCAVVLSAYYMPRLSFADVIYFTTKSGIKASVEQSFTQTQSYWGKIVGNGILFGLSMLGIVIGCVVAFLAVVIPSALLLDALAQNAILIAATLGFIGIALLLLVIYLGSQYLTFWGKCFHVELYKTIAAHPRTSSKS